MIQNQLVDYISSQMKAGISGDAIRSALVGVGWQAADVDESMKKVQNDMRPAAVPVTAPSAVSSLAQPVAKVTPAGANTSSFSISGVSPMRPVSGGVGATPTDVVGGGAKAAPATGPAGSAKPMAFTAPGAARPSVAANPSQPVRVSDFMGGSTMAGKMDKISGSGFKAPVSVGTGTPVSHTGERVSMVAEAVGLVALAALTIFFWTQNSTLQRQLAAVPSGGPSAQQMADLQAQIQNLTASVTSLQGQMASLTAQAGDLKTQLGFFAAPLPGSGGISATGTVSGTLTASVSAKGLYALRTIYDAVIYVKNGSDAKVAALLKPLVGTSITLSGSYILGSGALTVTAVNDQPVNPPAAATTTVSAATSSSTSAGVTTTTSPAGSLATPTFQNNIVY